MLVELNYLELIRGDARFIYLYESGCIMELLNQLQDDGSDAELGLGFDAACMLSEKALRLYNETN